MKKHGFLYELKKNKVLFLMAMPSILLTFFLAYLPMSGLVLAFKNYRYDLGIFGSEWNGFDNFAYLFQSGTGWLITRNTILYNLLNLITSQLLAVIVAIVISEMMGRLYKRIVQSVIFLPYFISWVIVGTFVLNLFNYETGVMNNLIRSFGGEPVNWINYGSTYTANLTVMIVYIVWNALPFKILVLLGGLQSINKQYYEAARVDGTPRWRVLTRITVPLLSPMLAYVIITSFIDGFKEYTSIVGIFGENMGPPDDAGRLNTMVGFIYDSLSTNSQGRASAAALILFAIILVVTLVNLRISKKRVHY